MVYNYLFDVLFNVLLFQVKKQEIYREVNWPQWVGVHQINHGHCSHLWSPTDFRHHQCDIWNEENGLGIEFVTIVVWFRIMLSLNGNDIENQSTATAIDVKIRVSYIWQHGEIYPSICQILWDLWPNLPNWFYAHDNSTDKLKFILIILATDKFTFICWKMVGWWIFSATCA